MMRDMKTLVILALGAAALLGADFVAEGGRWWARIQFLADDKLQGRDTGSEGYSEAAKYVAGKMEAFGLKPAGTSGYLRSEEHTSELQSLRHLVCRLLPEK